MAGPPTPHRDRRRRPPAPRDDPLWYKDAVIYQLHVKAFFDSNGDGIGDFRGLTREARLHPATSASTRSGCCRSIRRRCTTTATTSPTTTTSTRRTARATTSSDFVARGARARAARDHRAGHQPHLRPAPVVPGRAPRAQGLAEARLLRLERRPEQVRRHAHHLHRHREVELDVGRGRAGSTTGIASSATSPTSTSTTRRCCEAVLRTMRFWLDMGVDGFRLDAIPYLVEREGTNNENLPETHEVHQADPRATLDAHYTGPAPARRGEPVARGRARVLRRRRRMPHGVPLPADAAHVHGDRAGGPPPDRRDHAADAGHPGQLPVGDLPAQPRRADARDGDRPRARLHVPDVRRRPAHAHQPRHPPAPRAADGERPRRASS